MRENKHTKTSIEEKGYIYVNHHYYGAILKLNSLTMDISGIINEKDV